MKAQINLKIMKAQMSLMTKPQKQVFEGSESEHGVVHTLSLKVFRRKSLGTSSGAHVRTLDEVAWRQAISLWDD
jgi:hypothetical protein